MLSSIVALLGIATNATNAIAQPLPESRVLPGQQPLEAPAPTERGRPPSLLPAAPVPPPPERGRAVVALNIVLSEIEVSGNTVLPESEIVNTTRPFVGRKLTSADLLDLQRRVNQLYVDAGFAMSSATVPDQDLSNGILRIQVIEGRLSAIRIRGLKGFRKEYFAKRIAPNKDAPINLVKLEQRLQALQLDPKIRAVRARLSSDAQPGRAVLDLEIVEAKRMVGQATFSNDRAASIGALNLRLGTSYVNGFGRGDRVAFAGAFSEGLREAILEAEVPVHWTDTSLSTRIRYSESDVISNLFADLDIESRFWDVGVAVSQPLIRSQRFRWNARLAFELRESRNELNGEGFPSSAAASNGRLRVAAFRLSSDASYRDANQVLAARTTLSLGAPIFGASDTSSGVDDTEFTSLLIQMQWARRIERGLPMEIISRLDAQFAFDPLPPFERFSVGGVHTVRGYPENRLVRDSGIHGSIEFRIPVIRDVTGRPRLSITPFIDGGQTWLHNDRGPTPSPKNLLSAGLGIVATPWPWLSGHLYWGGKLLGAPQLGNEAQDRGIHFGLSLSYF